MPKGGGFDEDDEARQLESTEARETSEKRVPGKEREVSGQTKEFWVKHGSVKQKSHKCMPFTAVGVDTVLTMWRLLSSYSALCKVYPPRLPRRGPHNTPLNR